MATDVGSLYISLGLSLSELETDFIAADRTVNENIRRLSRQSEVIRLRSQVEIAGLDETEDAERILQIRTESLNQQMEIQRDRVRILTAELRSLTTAHGEDAAVTQRATLRLERERLALANLEREMRGLNDTQGESNGTFGELNDMLPAIPTKLQAVGLAFGALSAGIGAATSATKELLDEFRELQKQSYELNMSFPDTRNFLREMRLAGGDIGDYEGFIRGITDAYVKGEYDDAEFIALRKYGAEIVDATGRLKDFKDISEEVYQAWLKADEAGEGIEFLQLVGGESGVRDAIQLFQRLKEAREDAAKISKAGIDEEQLHKLDRSMNLVTEQASELKAALGDIFVPAAQAAAEKFFDVLHDGTEYLVENKDAIQKWGFVTEETFSTIANKWRELTSYQTPDTGDENVNKILDRLQWKQSFFNERALWGDQSSWSEIFLKLPRDIADSFGIISRAEERQKAFKDELEDTSVVSGKVTKILSQFKGELEDTNTVSGKMTQGLAALSEAQKKNGDVLSQYGIQRVKEFQDELADLKIELEFGDDEYRKSLGELDLWRKRELEDKLQVSGEERQAIEELYAAKLEQIEQEHSEKIAEAIQSNLDNAADIEFEMTHSAFEKQIRDIERWEEAQKEKAETAEEISAIVAESAAKEAQAFEREVDRIKNLTQSLEDEIFEMENSQYEADKRRALQKAQRALDEGVDLATIQRYLQDKFGQLDRRASESRAKGGDYTKTPEGARQSGGNGIMVIGADQIIDNGLIRGQQQVIGLLTDENKIRAQLMPKLDAEARDAVARIQATKDLTAAQKDLLQSAQQMSSGFQLIEGDKVTNQPQIIAGDQIVLPTQELQEFGAALQQATTEFEQELNDSAKNAADVQKSFADGVKDFPPEYFKNLADNAKAVSEMQGLLTRSTMDLIEAQDNLRDALKNLSNINPAQNAGNNQSTADNKLLQLSMTTQETKEIQESLDRTLRENDRRLREISDIPPQRKTTQKDEGLKFGFDWDVMGGTSGIGLSLLSLLQQVGYIAPHPALKAGAAITGMAIGAGFGAGTWNETEAARELSDDRLKAMPLDVDLSVLETSLNGIGENVQSILQAIQSERPQEDDKLKELFSGLPNIDEYIKSVASKFQSNEMGSETNLSELFSGLPAISENVQNILQAIQSERPQESDRLEELLGTLPNIEEYVKSVLLEFQSEENQGENNLSELLSGLPKISEDVQGILQRLQAPEETSAMTDYLTPLNNIDGKLQSILQATQMKETISFETVITPLNSINALVGNILTALSNRQPPQITVSPNNSINLGGAYVFDNAMKETLVNDITSNIVSEITTAVRQATSQSSYGYGA